MFWALFAINIFIWLAAIFYVIRGWDEIKESGKIDKKDALLPKIDEAQEILPIEAELPIEEIPYQEINPSKEFNEEDFCTRLGESNIVRFPADYVDEGHVKTLGGKTISVVDFVKNCYRQINFHSMETVIKREENKETFKVNIFDLVYDHYALSSEPFVEFFGRLKEEFKDEIESIKIHPDITPEGKKSFIERYDALPQLVVWNDRELFFVLVKTKEEYLEKRDMDFLDEFVVSKKLFKAKIFRVTEKKRLQNREALEVKG